VDKLAILAHLLERQKTMNKPKSWENIGRDKRREIYNTLRWCLPGARWLYENRNLFKDNELKKLSFSQTISGLNKSFRYMILYDVISGNPISIPAKKQRRENRIISIRLRAALIAGETGVSFDKVYPKLFVKMYEHI
jgi:hypothetical protein